MEFCRLVSAKDSLFTEAFALYGVSFPECERRLPDKQAALMANPLYHFNVIAENGALEGILLCWEGSGYSYIEHFAIHPAMRGKAIGSKAMEKFCAEHSPVILEIDPPVDETAVRRESFYRRLGFHTNAYAHLHPAYRKPLAPHALAVMSYPGPITEEEYRLFRRELAETVMQDA